MPRLNLSEEAEHRIRMGYSHVPPFLPDEQSRAHGQVQTNHTQHNPMRSPNALRHVATGYSVHPSSFLGEQSQDGQSQHNARHPTQYPGGQVQAQDEPALSPTETQGQPTHHVGWHPQPVEDQPCQCHKPTLHEDRHPQSVRHQTQYPHGQVQTNYTPYGPIPSPTMQPRQRQTQYPGAQAHAKYEPELSPIIVTVQPLPPIVQHEAQCSWGQVQTNHGPELLPIIVTISPRQCHLNCHSQAVQDPSQHHQPNPHPAYPNLIPPDGSVRYILPGPGPPDGFTEENRLQVPILYNPPGID